MGQIGAGEALTDARLWITLGNLWISEVQCG